MLYIVLCCIKIQALHEMQFSSETTDSQLTFNSALVVDVLIHFIHKMLHCIPQNVPRHLQRLTFDRSRYDGLYDDERAPLTSMDKLLMGHGGQHHEHQVDLDRHPIHRQLSHPYFCFLF